MELVCCVFLAAKSVAETVKNGSISPRSGHCSGNYGCPFPWNKCHVGGQCKGFSDGACNGFECCCYDN
jgi:hypothetical protein